MEGRAAVLGWGFQVAMVTEWKRSGVVYLISDREWLLITDRYDQRSVHRALP